MRDLKELADFLTGIRLVTSVLIVIAAFGVGARALPVVSGLVLLAWFTDAVDGTLARKSGSDRHSWLGDNDIGIDVSLAFSVVLYATASGFLAWPLLLGCMTILLFATLVFHSRSLVITFIGLSYSVFLYITLRHLFPAFLAALALGLFSVLFTRRRILENLVPFFRGFKELFRGQSETGDKESTEKQKV